MMKLGGRSSFRLDVGGVATAGRRSNRLAPADLDIKYMQMHVQAVDQPSKSRISS